MKNTAFHWSSTHRSHVGQVRSLNEDACLDLPERGIWVVADGMGGHAAGDLASRLIVDSLKGTGPGHSLGERVGEVEQRLDEVNDRLRTEARDQGEQIIGSTVAVLIAFDRHCVYLWAGDSRVYLFRRGRLKQISRDHSQVEEMIEEGLMPAEQAQDHPLSNYITRAVGADEELCLEMEIIEPRDGDIFLLCSDGLNKEVADREIEEILRRNLGLAATADRLLKLTLTRGARDNVTLVLAQADHPPAATAQQGQ